MIEQYESTDLNFPRKTHQISLKTKTSFQSLRQGWQSHCIARFFPENIASKQAEKSTSTFASREVEKNLGFLQLFQFFIIILVGFFCYVIRCITSQGSKMFYHLWYHNI